MREQFRGFVIGVMFLSVGLISGLYIYGTQAWPYHSIREIESFIRGHSGEQTSLAGKFVNDLDIKPWRVIFEFPEKTFSSQQYHQIKGLPLNSRRTAPLLATTKKVRKGYRLIYGPFDFDKTRNGAILFDEQGHVKNVWQTSQEYAIKSDYDKEYFRPDTNVVPHGMEIAPDGSILMAYDNGGLLTKYDFCGKEVWSIKGLFHHSIAFEGEKAFWTWKWDFIKKHNSLVKINYADGAIIKKFSTQDIERANPEIDIFGIREMDTANSSVAVNKGGHKWHPNDIDPLPHEFAEFFPAFRPGDLLVSYRSPNLVFVLDQNSLKVKWWRQGLTRRQHDPDWNQNGTITIYNNNMHRKFSSIISVNPRTFDAEVLLDGKNYNFYSWQMGKHQVLDDGTLLITSPYQGRVFEVNSSGQVTLEFVNSYDDDGQVLLISEARFLPSNFFKELPTCL